MPFFNDAHRNHVTQSLLTELKREIRSLSTWSGMEIICLFVCDLFVSTLFISTWNRDVVGTACIRNKEQEFLTKRMRYRKFGRIIMRI